MAMLQPKITSIKEAVAVDPATQKAVPHMVVTFTVGNHGPFTESFLKSTFDPNGVNARITDFAQKLGLLQGS